MESHSHRRRSNAGAMPTEEDRLSGLPDDLLHSILRGLPLKQGVRTSALSRRWAPQWLRALAASPVLDLTDRDFARGQPLARAAATVGRCLRLHAEHGGPLDAFRVALVAPPSDLVGGGALARDVVGWVAAAVVRGAREVGVDLMAPPSQDEDAVLELPGDVFEARNSLERLALGRISLRAVALPAAGLAGLRSLSLRHADVTDEAVEAVLASCGALESLALTGCHLLTSVSVASERLRALELVGCRAMRELRVAAPALESFIFHGRVYDTDIFHGGLVEFDLGAMAALRDAYLSHLGCGFDVNHDGAYPYLYHAVAHARTLTICSVALLLLEEHIRCDTTHSRLEELQLLVAYPERNMILKHLSTIFAVTRRTRRLFVRIISPDVWYGKALGYCSVEDEEDSDAYEGEEDRAYESDEDRGAYESEEDGDAHELTLIKVVNFRGTRRVLWLLRFLLKRAPVLEQLVLVTPEGEGAPGDEQLEAIRKRVSRLHKASREARISVCRPSEDDSPNHAHTRFFHDEFFYDD